MATVNIDDLQPGQVLAIDATHHSGKVLLKAGATLTENHLKIFRTWGLTRVEVEGDDSAFSDASNENNHELIEQVKTELQARFQHVDLKHPAMKEIFHLGVCYHTRKLKSDSTT